jgi:hypothetical protein
MKGFYFTSGSSLDYRACKKEKLNRKLVFPDISDRIPEKKQVLLAFGSFKNETSTKKEKTFLSNIMKSGSDDTNPCDTIVLVNEKKIIGTITEVTEGTLKIKSCGSTSEETNTIPKSQIDHIIFGNGAIEKIDQKKVREYKNVPVPKTETPVGKRKINPFALWGLMLIFCAFLSSFLFPWQIIFLFLLFAFIFSIIGFIQTLRNKTKYKGLLLAIIGLSMTIIIAAFVTLVILFGNS